MTKQEPRLILECQRCGHKWLRRNLDKLPEVCPNRKCKSPYWDIPRKKVSTIQTEPAEPDTSQR